eukprot:1002258-Amphidinium_carterae.1
MFETLGYSDHWQLGLCRLGCKLVAEVLLASVVPSDCPTDFFAAGTWGGRCSMNGRQGKGFLEWSALTTPTLAL